MHQITQSERSLFCEASSSGSPKLAHMSPDPKDLANIIDEFPNVRAGLASDPEKNFSRIDLYISDVVDPPLSHIPPHSGSHWWPRKNIPDEIVEYFADFLLFHVTVERHQADVFLTGK